MQLILAKSANKRVAVQCFGVLLLLLCGGCWPGIQMLGAYEKDASGKKEFWGGYEQGQRYVLSHDMFLMKVDHSARRMYALVPPRELTYGNCNLFYSAPASTAAYHLAPGQWPDAAGIIEAGTVIQCEMLLEYGALFWGTNYSVFAKILNGPFSGTLVDLTDLSYPIKGRGGHYLDTPNYELITREEDWVTNILVKTATLISKCPLKVKVNRII